MLQLARDPAAGRPRHWSAILERRYAPARIAELSESIYASICNPPAPAV
jgi:hypothetical protein